MKKLLSLLLAFVICFLTFSFSVFGESEALVKITVTITEIENKRVGTNLEFHHYLNGIEFRSGEVLSISTEDTASLRTVVIEQDKYPDQNAVTSSFSYADEPIQKTAQIRLFEELQPKKYNYSHYGDWEFIYNIEPAALITNNTQNESDANKEFFLALLILAFGGGLSVLLWKQNKRKQKIKANQEEVIAVTTEEFGLIISELTRIRANELCDQIEKYGSDLFSIDVLYFTASLFHFSACKKFLSKKYPSNIVSKIIDSAFQPFIAAVRKTVGDEMAEEALDFMPTIDEQIEMGFTPQKTDSFHHPIRILAKNLLQYCTFEDDEFIDESFVLETTTAIAGWIQFSDFLLTKYKLIIDNENPKAKEDPQSENSHFCIYCGAEIPADDAAAFCYRCGKPLFKK